MNVGLKLPRRRPPERVILDEPGHMAFESPVPRRALPQARNRRGLQGLYIRYGLHLVPPANTISAAVELNIRKVSDPDSSACPWADSNCNAVFSWT
jgi:hypothetical protein